MFLSLLGMACVCKWVKRPNDPSSPTAPAETPPLKQEADGAVRCSAWLGRLSQKLPQILMKYEGGFHMSKVDDTPEIYKKEMEIMSLKILCELLQGEIPEEHLKGLDATAKDLQLALSNATD